MSYNVFYITASSMEEAQKIAKTLVEERLAACVNIVPEIHSYFRWAGKVDFAKECMLIGKTETGLIEIIKQRVTMLHSYEVPEIIFLSITNGAEPYLNWIRESIVKE